MSIKENLLFVKAFESDRKDLQAILNLDLNETDRELFLKEKLEAMIVTKMILPEFIPPNISTENFVKRVLIDFTAIDLIKKNPQFKNPRTLLDRWIFLLFKEDKYKLLDFHHFCNQAFCVEDLIKILEKLDDFYSQDYK